MLRRALLTFACAYVVLASSARAQDQSALQAAGLFVQSCVHFAGQTQPLRAWIKAHNLPETSPAQAIAFAEGYPAEAFGAGNRFGKMVLVSQDDGACRVAVQFGDASNVERAVTSDLAQSGITVVETLNRTRPGVTQRLYRATNGVRHWLLSVTANQAPAGSNSPPQIVLLATLDPGGSLGKPQP